jgi:hypothetical protein
LVCRHQTQNVFQILDVQLSAAIQKAIDGIPPARDKQAVENVRQEIIDGVREAPRDLPGPEFFPQSIPFYASTAQIRPNRQRRFLRRRLGKPLS